jgi:hypothetical protein
MFCGWAIGNYYFYFVYCHCIKFAQDISEVSTSNPPTPQQQRITALQQQAKRSQQAVKQERIRQQQQKLNQQRANLNKP